MKKQFVTYPIAKQLKELGFNENVPHCYINNSSDEYELELFSFFLCNSGTLGEIYEEEKKLRNFDPTNDLIQNESEVYFNYNQDIRKLVARLYNGEEYMDDPKSYNMYVDSYTYHKWTPEDEEKNKLLLPNYNDGDFDFTVYSDVISAPAWQDVIDWFREKHNISIYICDGYSRYLPADSLLYEYSIKQINPRTDDQNYGENVIMINSETRDYCSYYDVIRHAILKAIELIKEK